MKTLTLIILSSIIFFACENVTDNLEKYSGNAKKITQQNSVGFGEAILFTKNDNLYSIKFNDVEESRCPTKLDCLWEGEAVVELIVSDENGKSNTIKISTQEPNAKIYDLTIDLIKVNPYPEENLEINKSEYEIELDIN